MLAPVSWKVREPTALQDLSAHTGGKLARQAPVRHKFKLTPNCRQAVQVGDAKKVSATAIPEQVMYCCCELARSHYSEFESQVQRKIRIQAAGCQLQTSGAGQGSQEKNPAPSS